MNRIELLAHLLTGSANYAPNDGLQDDERARRLVKRANKIADIVFAEEAERSEQAKEKRDKLWAPPSSAANTESTPEPASAHDPKHVERTRSLLAENGFTSPEDVRPYQPGPGQVGRIVLECGLIVSFYRSGKTNFGGRDPGPSARTDVLTLLRMDGWKGANSTA